MFHVAEEMLCVPKLTFGPGPTCMLRVVNNDTGEEIPRVFQKVAPYVYKRNKVGSGYDFFLKISLNHIHQYIVIYISNTHYGELE